MATRDLSGAFEQRVREIVQPMLDEAVERAVSTMFGGMAGGAGTGRRGRGRPAGTASAAGKQACNVAGCVRPMRSKGYCAAHYQSARKYGWPMPAPKGFNAPVRKRGRPPKNAAASEKMAVPTRRKRGRKPKAAKAAGNGAAAKSA